MSNPNHIPEEAPSPVVTPEYMLRMGALGIDAVLYAEHAAQVITNMPAESYEPGLAEIEEQNLDETLRLGLQVERQGLAESKDNLHDFYRGVEALGPPKFLQHALGAKNTMGMVRRAMLEDANPRGRANFFQWYNEALAEKQQQFETTELPRQFEAFHDRLSIAEADDVVAAGTAERFARKVADKKIHVQFTDSVSTHGTAAIASQHRNGESVIQINNEDQDDELEHALTHELGHTLEGVAYPESTDPDQLRPDEHGLGRVFGNNMGASAVGEATDELLADSLLHGHIEDIDPRSENRQHSKHYQAEQYMLSYLCYGGNKRIDPRVFTRAATAEGTAQTSIELQQVGIELDEAFPGMDMINRIRNMAPNKGEDNGSAIVRFVTESQEAASAVSAQV